jgi:hypothetical protein
MQRLMPVLHFMRLNENGGSYILMSRHNYIDVNMVFGGDK